MKSRVVSLCFLGGLLALPACAGPLPFADLMHRSPSTVQTNLTTTWGFGQRENLFNDLIVKSVSDVWQDATTPLPPVLYKSLMAVESSFRPDAVSGSGAAGLTQLMPDTAKRFGLASRDRLDPNKSVPVGILAFQEKYQVVLDPGNYSKVIGQPADKVAFSVKVAEFYTNQGAPQGDDRWHLALAAYNGGGGTILRAMSYAIDVNLDPRQWDNLAGPPGKALNTPLHKACIDVYGPSGGSRKVNELAAYPRKIMNLYHSAVAATPRPVL
ncbi:MAG: transglycosylase SLT domain-containing protein [Candidatus Eremiobacteraeota bacterium]|nr:transglycosylase SLT domain-containing protein [Candidatus Eremiobacteraeota bacterium]MCW5869833.1 transglycosylase SLT domain-containing protein [Candidatus Eremiobacteraeota bacterium]